MRTMLQCQNCAAFVGEKYCQLNPPNATVIMAQGVGGVQPAVLSYYPEVSPLMGCSQGIEKPSAILS